MFYDGSHWSLYGSPSYLVETSLIYGNGYFLAFGSSSAQSGVTEIYQSTNGLNYTPLYADGSLSPPYTAAYGNNTWVFISQNYVLTGTLTPPNWNWYQPWYFGCTPMCITFANGQFIMGALLNLSELIFTSPDGLIWTCVGQMPSSQPYCSYNGLCFGNGVYVANTANYLGYSNNAYQFEAITYSLQRI